MNLKSQISIYAGGNIGRHANAVKIGLLYLILVAGGAWHLLGLFTNIMKFLAGPVMILLAIWIIVEFHNALPKRKQVNFLVWSLAVVCVSLGVEIVGEKTGLIFGEYDYGQVLQPSISGVPLAIGFAWVSILLSSKGIVDFIFGKIPANWFFCGLTIAFFMVVFDLFLEQAAVNLEYWNWIGSGIPLQNYLAWFFLGALFSWIGERLQLFPVQSPGLAKHLYVAQLLYFLPVIFL